MTLPRTVTVRETALQLCHLADDDLYHDLGEGCDTCRRTCQQVHAHTALHERTLTMMRIDGDRDHTHVM